MPQIRVPQGQALFFQTKQPRVSYTQSFSKAIKVPFLEILHTYLLYQRCTDKYPLKEEKSQP
jgi:hypothetical protein